MYSIQQSLIQKSGKQKFPKDVEVIDALKVKDVYNINSKNRVYLLEKLENYENNEKVFVDGNANVTIEHIFPQNPDPKWKIDLGNEEYIFIKENYLNTVSNLTLSGNNGKLGNKTFAEKRDLENIGYKDSRLWLNKHLSKLDIWNRTEIEKRFERIAERFLKIWEYPQINLLNEVSNGEINIFEAEDAKHKKLEYAIFFNQKIEVHQITKLYIEVFKKFFEIKPEIFFTTNLGSRIGLTKNPDKDNLRQAASINNTYFIESNIDNNGKFDRIKQALTIFESEDELMIKYAEN